MVVVQRSAGREFQLSASVHKFLQLHDEIRDIDHSYVQITNLDQT